MALCGLRQGVSLSSLDMLHENAFSMEIDHRIWALFFQILLPASSFQLQFEC